MTLGPGQGAPSGNSMSPTEMAQAILGEPAPTAEVAPETATPPSDGGSTAPDFAARAAAAEQELAAEFGMEIPAAETAATPEAEPQGEGDGLDLLADADPVEALVNTKYGGDKKKFIDGLHEGWRSAAELAKVNKELQARLDRLEQGIATPKTEPAPVEAAPPDITEDIKWFDQEISSLEKEVQSGEARKGELINLGRVAQAKLLKAQGKLEIADEIDQPRIQDEIARIEAEIKGYNSEYVSITRQAKDASYTSRKLRLDKQEALARMENLKKEQEANNRKQVEAEQKVLQDFLGYFKNSALENGIPQEPEVLRSLVATVRAEAAYALNNLERGVAFDLKAFTEARVAHHAKMYGFAGRAGFKQVSKEKQAATTKPAPKGTGLPRPLPPVPQGPWSADFAKKRASKILG